MLVASICNIIFASALGLWGEGRWNRDSIPAVLYLGLFASLIGFSACTWLLQNVPDSKVSTYEYVNPMVAVMLGALLLRETLHSSEWLGMVIILVAVFLVTSSKFRSGSQLSPGEQMMVGAEIP